MTRSQHAQLVAAQSRWDAISEPEGGPTECAECDGTGEQLYAGEDMAEPCPYCNNGLTDEDGNPWTEPEDDGERNA